MNDGPAFRTALIWIFQGSRFGCNERLTNVRMLELLNRRSTGFGPKNLLTPKEAGRLSGVPRRTLNIPVSEQLRKALDDIGGEPLEGFGFKNETMEPEFTQESASEGDLPQAG